MLSICRNLTASDISRKFIYPLLSANMSAAKSRKVHTAEELPKHSRLVWVDCEMTGLNKEVDHLLEIACLITDANLDIVAEGPNIVIHQPDTVLTAMGNWCQEHHGQSGLTEAVRNSKISLADAESAVLKFVEEHTPKQACPLAGNSVHADREFLVKYMPRLVDHLHYRIVDVSTIKELCRRWYPSVYDQAPKKKLSHRALDDIKESVAELKYYRNSIFIN